MQILMVEVKVTAYKDKREKPRNKKQGIVGKGGFVTRGRKGKKVERGHARKGGEREGQLSLLLAT